MTRILPRSVRLTAMIAVSSFLCVSQTPAESPPVLPAQLAPAVEPAPEIKIHRQLQFVSQKAEAANHVIKAEADLGEAGLKPDIAAKLKLDEVDFTKQMVVIIESGMTNSFGVQLSILEASEATGGAAVINWQYKPYFGGAAPPDQPGNPTLVLVMDRHDGEVKFRRTNWQWPKDLPPPPSAPPGGGPGGLVPR